ncbi:MAG: hypothetical protein ACTHJS_18740 [Xanthobacteraceae bacterium]|jgi:hypothetical protein
MPDKGHCSKRARRLWVLTMAIVGLAAIIARPGIAGPKTSAARDDTTGTVSKAEPPIKQDGTAAHPYADASQCPSSTDVVIWPNGRTIPRLPSGIAVCFVGERSFNTSGPASQLRKR